MKRILTALTAALLLNASVATIQHSYAAVAQGQRGPVDVVRRVIELTDGHQLPDWRDSAFDEALAPFLTETFRSAIRHGRALGGRFNILDGDLFLAGAQNVAQVKMPDTPAGAVFGDVAVLVASLETSDGSGSVTFGPNVTYWFKKENGVWKIDDLRAAEGTFNDQPTMKQLFRSPEKYLRPVAADARSGGNIAADTGAGKPMLEQ